MTAQKRHHIVILRKAASDIEKQAVFYKEAQGSELALRWQRAVYAEINTLEVMPERGSPSSFPDSRARNIRHIRVSGFPKHLIFYQFLPLLGLVRVRRISHGARDLEPLISAH